MKRVMWTIIFAFLITLPSQAAAMLHSYPPDVPPAPCYHDHDITIIIVVDECREPADWLVFVVGRNRLMGVFTLRQLPTGLETIPELVERNHALAMMAADRAEAGQDISDIQSEIKYNNKRAAYLFGLLQFMNRGLYADGGTPLTIDALGDRKEDGVAYEVYQAAIVGRGVTRGITVFGILQGGALLKGAGGAGAGTSLYATTSIASQFGTMTLSSAMYATAFQIQNALVGEDVSYSDWAKSIAYFMAFDAATPLMFRAYARAANRARGIREGMKNYRFPKRPGAPKSARQLSEADYLKRIEFLEQNYGTSNVHSLQKHGAQTTGLSQYRRVQNVNYPTPGTGLPGNPTKNASKFLSHKDHYHALRKAILEHKRTGANSISVAFDRNIGMNIQNLGTHSSRGPFSAQYVRKAVVRFDDATGKFFTAYPEP